jgi:hypothetical protein
LAVAFRASNEAHATLGSLSVTIPATVQAGDLLILVGGLNNAGNASYDWATPSGWTRRDDRALGSNVYAAVYAKIAASGDAGSTVTLTSSTTGKSCAIVAAYSGVDQSQPIDVMAALTETVSTASHATPTVTTTVDQDWVVVACIQSDSAADTWSTATGYTKRQDSTDNVNTGGHVVGTLQDKGPLAVGTYGGETLTATTAAIKAATWTIAVSPQQSTQTARPVSDVDVTNAVGVPTPGAGSGVYADLAANDDAHYAEISNGGDVEVLLSSLIDPLSSSGHTVSYRADYGGGATSGSIAVELRQGTTVIASWTDTLTGSFQTFTHTLSAAEADAITDYADLRLRFTATVA